MVRVLLAPPHHNHPRTHNNNSMPRQLESALHALLPVVFAALATVFLSQHVVQRQFGTDAACTAAPLVFAATLGAAMLFVGSAESSFATGGGSEPFATSRHNGNNNNSNDGDDDKNHGSAAAAVYYVIRQRVAWGHVVLLLLVPPLMHLTLFGGRIVSRYASTDDLCDFLLSLTAPCVLLSVMHWLHESNLRYSPYAGVLQLSNSIAAMGGGGGDRQRFLISTVIPFGAIVLTSVVLQLRYLIPMCHRFAYHFVGVQFPTWLLTLYWTIATISMLAAGFFWGRVSATTGQPLFGEYHEDFVQLCLAVSGLCLGKAVGLPWNMTPLPILGILGLSLWMYTRMMRYLAIFLFVVHATGVVVFTYRFVGIDQVLSLPLPGVELSLTRFGMVVIFASILIGLVVGLAVRSTGGYMARMLKMVDAAGMVMIAYTVLLTILEIALMKRPVPTKELAGVQLEEDEAEEMLYGQGLVFLTSALLIGISLFMKRVRILQERSAVVVVSLAIGKAVAVFIDTAETESGGASKGDPSGTAVLLRALVASLLCAVMFAPRVFLQPVHVKSPAGRQRRSFSGGPDLPKSAMRMIFLYAFVFLPITLIVTIPYVLFPLINVLAGIYRNESYYSVSTPISELLGAAMCLWGLACISMLNFYLPDGGGAAWKKLSALAFLMGIGIIFTAPTMGMSVGKAANSPYASMSSLGSQLISRSKSRTGGWGILSAALATLLAVLGPLELKERRDTSGRKDKYLLFRTMVFSLLFGGGVSWFITVQSMSEAQWIFLVLTLIASMALAFLGTVAAVLGHFVEPENFDEVEMVARTWFVALVAFLPISGIPQLFQSGSVVHPFGVGGWLSTYLTVASLSALSFSLSLSFRHGKDQQTRGLGNIGCLVSWICAIAVLYGRFGVAGLDTNFNVTSIAGIPATIIGTLLFGTILLALEGETSSQARGRRVSVTTSHKGSRSSLRLNLPQLTRGNRWFPPFVLTVTVFLVASLYTVLLRGSGLLPFSGSVARSHEDVFANVFGSAASVSDEAHDLATLAEKSVSHSLALTTSAKLAGSGFWTAKGFFGPLLHLAGVFATLPSLFLLVNQYWLGLSVPSAQVTVGLPLNIIPVALCRGIPVLQAAALLVVAGAIAQLLLRRQVEQISKMRL